LEAAKGCGVKLSRMLVHVRAVDKVIRRPWPGKLHPALLQLLRRRGVLVLVTFYRLVINQMSDVQKHLARIHPLAGDLLGDGQKHAVHLDRESARFGLALALSARALPQTGQVLLSDGHISVGMARTGIVYHYFEMHLGLAAQTLDVGLKVSLIGANGTAKRVVVLEGGAEPEGKNCGKFETVRDYAGMVFGGLLIEPVAVFRIMLGDNDR